MLEFNDEKPSFGILKHNNACGFATRDTLKKAYIAALSSDPISAFGGVLISNSCVESDTAAEINSLFCEIVIAPSFSNEALKILKIGGNAVDAACAMVAATATMWDVLGWGGETQALIYHPKLKKVIGINALGVAPSGATPEFYKERGYSIPPKYGPLAAVTPGTPAGIMVMLAEYGTMSLADILQPSIEMAKGYPIEAQAANSIERNKEEIKKWKYSKNIFWWWLLLVY